MVILNEYDYARKIIEENIIDYKPSRTLEYLARYYKQCESLKDKEIYEKLNDFMKRNCDYYDYVNLVKHVKEHKIGKMKLANIKPLHITEFFTDILDYSKSFRNQMRFVLNGGFECAIDNDLCLKNPVKRAEIAKKLQTEKESFTEDEVKKILDFAKNDELFGTAIYIMLNAGIRSGEMRALTVDKFDFKKGVVTIDKAVKRNGTLGLPKNKKTRIVPLNPKALKFLEEKLYDKTGYVLGDNYYISADGFKCRYNWFFNRLNKHLKNVSNETVVKKPPHVTRHTCATLWQDKGMPLEIISELLGHQSTGVTKGYTHTQINTLAQAVTNYMFAQ